LEDQITIGSSGNMPHKQNRRTEEHMPALLACPRSRETEGRAERSSVPEVRAEGVPPQRSEDRKVNRRRLVQARN
jgi:hypothetical protein